MYTTDPPYLPLDLQLPQAVLLHALPVPAHHDLLALPLLLLPGGGEQPGKQWCPLPSKCELTARPVVLGGQQEEKPAKRKPVVFPVTKGLRTV
jgi:hypothetical protein